MIACRPFQIPAFEAEVADLKRRLGQVRWPDGLPAGGWQHGADIGYLRSLCAYWAESYDWNGARATLNEIPQYSAVIDGVDLHFWHVRGRSSGRPLLLLHGWPGSQAEFAGIIGPLSDPEADGAPGLDAFNLVVPALPGFGFGGKPAEPGWSADRMASAFDTLMRNVLGYGRYGIQGGDWGSIIGTRMAARHPENIAGLHLNMPYCAPPPGATPDAAWASRMEQETGYLHLQNTRPDALAVGLADSPAGLAAWIVEKFAAWSDCDGDVESAIPRDTLLTNLMFYWLPNSAGSAARIYAESTRLTPPLFGTSRITVPTGVAAFPKEPYRCPRDWMERQYDITHWTEMSRGGHFPALERPDDLVRDIRAFFRTISW